jgi:hydroxyacylglutathione hydrolase
LKKELDAGEQYQILDVRRTGEYQDGHVPAAINVPLAELPGRLNEVPTGSQIAVICASGYRSSIAKSVLERAGFKPLLNVLGGTTAWKNAGYELEQKETSVV